MGLSPCGSVCHKVECQSQTFVSLFLDLQALAVDALYLLWQDLWAYTCPSYQLLTKVLTYLHQSNAQLLLGAPA